MRAYFYHFISGLLLLLLVAITLLYYSRREVLWFDVNNVKLFQCSVVTLFGTEYMISKTEQPSALLTFLVSNQYVIREANASQPRPIRLLDCFPAHGTRHVRSELYMDIFQDENFWLSWTVEHEDRAKAFWSELFAQIRDYRGDDESYGPIFRAIKRIERGPTKRRQSATQSPQASTAKSCSSNEESAAIQGKR